MGQDRRCGSDVAFGVPLVGLWLGNAVCLCCVGGDTWDGLGSWGVFFTCAADRGRSATALRYRLGDCSRGRGVGGGRFWQGWEAHGGGR